MIAIVKPSPPAHLSEKGAAATSDLQEIYEISPEEYRLGRELPIDSSIYGHLTVRAALRKIQHGKCCYCEAAFEGNAYGEIEHFRPKGGFRQETGKPTERPGYFWLAYQWGNLFLSCPVCNRNKGSYFPLLNPEDRCRFPQTDLARERPALLDPGDTEDRPEHHIQYEKEQPIALAGSERGKATIQILDLNRYRLWERRYSYYQELSRLYDVFMIATTLEQDGHCPSRLAALATQSLARLKSSAAREAEFSAMAASFLAQKPLPPIPASWSQARNPSSD